MPVNPELFKAFAAFRRLRTEGLAQLAKHAERSRHEAGSWLFRCGERSTQALLLLHGIVQIEDQLGRPIAELRGSTASASDAFGTDSPQLTSARCISDVLCLRIDASLLEITLSWDQSSGVEVAEIGGFGDQDWIFRLLQTRTMQELPSAHLQALFMAMHPLDVRADTRIIEQGASGDYFYVIDEGECRALYERGPDSEPELLARFVGGDCFGEEALISGAPRSATVVASRASRLRRIDRANFLKLLNEPLTRSISLDRALARISKRQALWLDLRADETAPLEHSIRVPAHLLRSRSEQLDPDREYICVCENGFRSRVATFLLQQRGIGAFALEGGFDAAIGAK
ncbi:hypothetical protein WQQ_40820 [Hydrocarboniphaga effusa AP103]|uniref:Cyclic nucleotide-binding domain-containing protein n=1 Tax=Hydrocarboniphaga effusa AP103 TaxID=1172194 RepID=I7Z7Q7_9GAMM|nr:hypothetical protein WQQ_40820 [Hydrocarboniphaga effusa AP103]